MPRRHVLGPVLSDIPARSARPVLSVGPSSLCRGQTSAGARQRPPKRSLCGARRSPARRSLCWGLVRGGVCASVAAWTLFVSGFGGLYVGARRSVWDRRSLCRGGFEMGPGAVCVRFRRSLCRGPAGLAPLPTLALCVGVLGDQNWGGIGQVSGTPRQDESVGTPGPRTHLPLSSDPRATHPAPRAPSSNPRATHLAQRSLFPGENPKPYCLGDKRGVFLFR